MDFCDRPVRGRFGEEGAQEMPVVGLVGDRPAKDTPVMASPSCQSPYSKPCSASLLGPGGCQLLMLPHGLRLVIRTSPETGCSSRLTPAIIISLPQPDLLADLYEALFSTICHNIILNNFEGHIDPKSKSPSP